MKEQAIRFLKEKVIGKQLETEKLRYTLEEGKMEALYSDKMNFSDLIITENGFQFNMTVVTDEKIYGKDQNGESKLVKDYTGTGVFHYELALRKSTSEITGVMRLLSSTTKEHTMEGVVYGIYGVKIEDEQLKWKEQQLLYRDMPVNNERFRPVAFDAEIRFYFEESKLRFEYIPTYSDVDVKTMIKTLSKDQYPPFVSKEK